jgi:GNAT superfamily N-acetyltransferase
MKGQFVMKDLLITKPTKKDLKSAYAVFETTIPDIFEKEGIGHLKEEILKEIAYKKHIITDSLENTDSDFVFLVAKMDDKVIGTISFGPCGNETKKCTNHQLDAIGELGSLYVLPHFQGKGVGSALIQSMIMFLHELGVEQFCLDSGFKSTQKRWLRKFGEPYKIAKDYWGEGSDHMVWLCQVTDFVK